MQHGQMVQWIPAWERGRHAWPAFEISLEDFSAHITARLEPAAPADPALPHAEDLYLCCACARALPAALIALDRLLADVPAWVRHLDPSSDFADEIRQRLR